MGVEDRNFLIGDVHLMQFYGSGSAQKGWRPGVVFQNNIGNRFSPNIVALPMTSTVKKNLLPTQVYVPKEDAGLAMNSVILCENPQTISKHDVGRYLTTIPDSYMKKVAKASLIASSAISFLDLPSLIDTWKRAVGSNSVDTREEDNHVQPTR